MAMKVSITSSRFAGTLAGGFKRDIGILGALRGGVAAMSSRLAAIADKGDAKAERAFENSLDELSRLDHEILSSRAQGTRDLHLQASVVRQRMAEETLTDEQLLLLLDSIDTLAH